MYVALEHFAPVQQGCRTALQRVSETRATNLVTPTASDMPSRESENRAECLPAKEIGRIPSRDSPELRVRSHGMIFAVLRGHPDWSAGP
jgi:hypothetical protein